MVNKSERLCLFFETSFEGLFLAIARLSVEMCSRPSCTGSAVKSRSEITRSEAILVAHRRDLEQGLMEGRKRVDVRGESSTAAVRFESYFSATVNGHVDLHAGNLTLLSFEPALWVQVS
jgi:hypothetical protein